MIENTSAAPLSENGIHSANLTGGKGFSFENQVGAWFLLHMLAGVHPLGEELGSLQRLSFQIEPDGWTLDDLLLTSIKGSTTHRCAISIKSNRQFSAKKAPEDFVKRCWHQFLEKQNNPFCVETDKLVNITAKLSEATQDSLFPLLNAARVRSPAEMVRQLANGDLSKSSRALFKSFDCPADLATVHQVGPYAVPELLRCIVVRALDLEQPASSDKSHALMLCRQLLDSGEPQTAIKLWEALVLLVDRHRIDRGHIDLPVVLREVRQRFALKDHPDYAADWSRLWKDSQSRWQSVNNLIGGKTHFPRRQLTQEIESAFDQAQVVVLLGEPGGGKTVVARHWAEYRAQNEPVLWFDPRLLEISDLPELREKLGLSHSWQELVSGLSRSRVTVVMDGLDRILWRTESMKVAAQLLATLLPIEQETPFCVLLTCQEQAWADVQVALLQVDLPIAAWPVIVVPPVGNEEITILTTDFPALASLSFQYRLTSILRQPKILDLLARNTKAGKLPNFRSWAGESDVIDWVWRAEITSNQRATARQRLMWQLAEQQAQRLSVDVPLDVLGDVADMVLDSLAAAQICQCNDGRVSFSHDLWGDWARQRWLLAHDPDLPHVLETRLDSPAWHRAIVLLGLDLLERQSQPARWRELMERSESLEHGGAMICDLLLESLVRAAQTTDALAQAWPQLCAKDGHWLQRLLTRFLSVATSPNPAMLRYAESEGLSETNAASVHRLPKPILWIPLLHFLNNRREECVNLAPLQVAEIAGLWLRWTARDMPLRKETADLALTIAWQALRYRQHRRYSSGRKTWGDLEAIAKTAFQAAQHAIVERPDEVIAFALCACGRREPTAALPPEPIEPEYQRPNISPELEAALKTQSLLRALEIEIPPWQDGPVWPVDHIYRQICLNQLDLLPTIILKPEIAAEIILALIIRKGGKRSPNHYDNGVDYDFELENDMEWLPPLYNKGPFFHLLTAHPSVGLELIIKLVNFTTDRWLELQHWRQANERESEWLPREKLILGVDIPFDDGMQTWTGDSRWFFSYRDSTTPPDLLVSALMALEKWLYDQLDTETSIEPIVADIFSKTRSLALAGLLIGVAKKQPELLLGALRPFLSAPEIYEFDLHHEIGGEHHQMIGWSGRYTRKEIQTAYEWHNMPHRKKWLEHIVLELFFKSKSLQKHMETVRVAWQERLIRSEENGCKDDLLYRLFHQLNLANWRCDATDENTVSLNFVEPEEMRARNEGAQQLHENRQAIMILPFRCRQAIDGAQELSESEFNEIWQRGESLFDLDFEEVFEKTPRISKEDIAAGLIALAVCKFRDWLNRQPDLEKDCLETLIEIVIHPPPRTEFDVAESICDTSWDSFCADALPVLWKENRKLPALRQAIGALIFNFHYNIVQRLFRNLAEYREQLGDDFLRTHHLLLCWSVLRYRLDVLSGQLFGQEESSREELLEIANDLLNQFSDGSLSSNIPRWTALEHAFVDNRPSPCEADRFGRKRYYPRSPGMDLHLIQSAYDWLPDLNSANSEAERQHWLSLWQQSVSSLHWMLGEASPEIQEIDGSPYQFDRWLFQKLPKIIVSSKTSQEAESLWRPILELGAPAHRWIEDFLNDWWIYGLSDEANVQEQFLLVWKSMWEFVITSSSWNTSGNRHWDMDECFCALIGLGEIAFSIGFWDEGKETVVQSMTEHYRLWCDSQLSESTCARVFIRFLTKPAARSLRSVGMDWLDQAIAKHGFWYDSHKTIEELMVRFLDAIQTLIQNDIGKRATFFRLLRILVERQNPKAMALQEQLGV